MRIDLLYHYIGGQLLNKGLSLIGLCKSDNAIVSTTLMVGKELTDVTGFDWLDLGFGVLGWISLM